ncbi:MAG: TIGR02587 family membrane protein [Elainellaceae cyanobacterium]
MHVDPLSSIWQQEIQDILRGAAGGFLFGIPLLYTVEVWSIGSSTVAPQRLAVLGATFMVVLLLTQAVGFRRTLTLNPLDAVLESIEALGIGVVCAAIALVLLRRITLDTPLSEMLGKLIFEGVPFSLGVALAQSTLTQRRDDSPMYRGERRSSSASSRSDQTTSNPLRLQLTSISETLIDLDATLLGAILIAFSIAPTEEIPILAAAVPPLWLLLIVTASLVLSYIIVFASGFADRWERQQRGLLLGPVTETLVAYLVALVASTVMLIFFQQLSLQDPWQEWLSNTLVLGLPASVGGAAGRILR